METTKLRSDLKTHSFQKFKTWTPEEEKLGVEIEAGSCSLLCAVVVDIEGPLTQLPQCTMEGGAPPVQSVHLT